MSRSPVPGPASGVLRYSTMVGFYCTSYCVCRVLCLSSNTLGGTIAEDISTMTSLTYVKLALHAFKLRS
jgi:hypothetical protein